MDFFRRRRKAILILAGAALSGAALSGAAAYKLYHLPSVAARRRKLSRLFAAILSVADAVSSSTETLSLLSSDLNSFLRSDSDQVPPSLIQLSKLASSDEFAGSVSRISEALTAGIVRGLGRTEAGASSDSGFSDRALDKVFSPAGSGFASAVVGSFARNLVMAFYEGSPRRDSDPSNDAPEWVKLLLYSEKSRDLMADWIQVFVSTAVAVYLDKTMEINTYDEFFAGLTSPKHEERVKEVLVSVCNGAVETLVKTSHQVLTESTLEASEDKVDELEQEGEELSISSNPRSSFDGKSREGGGWFDQVSSTLAVPSNRRFVLDVTGRVTFETVRSFLEFVLWKLCDGARRGVHVVREEILERGLEVVRYFSAKSMVVVTVCIALCMHVLSGPRILMPA